MIIKGQDPKNLGVMQDARVNASGGLQVTSQGSNAQVLDGTAAWADSAAQDTEVNLDIALPTPLPSGGLYTIFVKNPSANTGLDVSVRSKETFDAASYAELTSWNVAAGANSLKLVQGWGGEALRLTLSNDTALGVGEGFTAYVSVRSV